MQAPEQESEAARGTAGGRAPSEAGSERSEASWRSRHTAGGDSEATSGARHAVREVVVPMPSLDDLGTAHLDPPLVRVTLAPRQPDPACTQRVAPGPNGRQRHLTAVWDVALEAQVVQSALRISVPCPIVVMGGSNLPQGQERVGMFAYRLVSGHWRVRTGVARTREEGTVTMAGVLGLNVTTGCQQRKAEWVDVAWLAMRVHVGRKRKGGWTSLTLRGRRMPPPPTPSARKRKASPPPPQGDTDAPPPPSPRKPRVRPPRRSGRSRRQGGGRGGGGEWVQQQYQLQRARAWEVRDERAGHQP